MIPQAEFHLSSNNDAHHIRRPRLPDRSLPALSVCRAGGRARCRCHHSLAGDIILYLRRREGGRNGDKRGSAASGSDSRNIKNSNDGGARMSRWFSWEMPEISAGVLSEFRLSLSLCWRVCVLHLRTEKLTSREEWRELFVGAINHTRCEARVTSGCSIRSSVFLPTCYLSGQ